jgi:dsRNA-specific ribonuclease
VLSGKYLFRNLLTDFNKTTNRMQDQESSHSAIIMQMLVCLSYVTQRRCSESVEDLSFWGKTVLGFATVPSCGKYEGKNCMFLEEMVHQ